MTEPALTYRYYCNVSEGAYSGYYPNDRMILAWQGQVPDIDVSIILERLFDRFNRDDRPTGQTCNSMSVGDVVVLDNQAWACERIGWVKAEMPANVIDRTWAQALDDRELAARDASLGVGHIWTETKCPAYRTLIPGDCHCR